MSGRKGPRAPTATVRRNLEAALQRLLDGRPRNKDLREAASRGKLRVTVAAVALEAGHSRTLIGSDECRFPDIRARIIDAGKDERQPVTTVTRLANSMRARNAELRAEVQALRSVQAAMLARVVEAERRLEMAERELARSGDCGPAGGGGPEDGNIVPFLKGGRDRRGRRS